MVVVVVFAPFKRRENSIKKTYEDDSNQFNGCTTGRSRAGCERREGEMARKCTNTLPSKRIYQRTLSWLRKLTVIVQHHVHHTRCPRWYQTIWHLDFYPIWCSDGAVGGCNRCWCCHFRRTTLTITILDGLKLEPWKLCLCDAWIKRRLQKHIQFHWTYFNLIMNSCL